jgi:hypothetical protein
MEAAMTSTRSRSPSRLLFVLAAVAVTLFGLVLPASATGPYCGITWGSLDKMTSPSTGPFGGRLVDVRAGQHECFDRLVVDVAGAPGAGYAVGYVDEVTQDPSGFPVPLRGGAFLQVTVFAPDHDAGGNLTYRPADRRELVDTAGFSTFRQVAWAGAFEANSSIGLGVRARLPFRVLPLEGPGSGGRVVIDVAHRW